VQIAGDGGAARRGATLGQAVTDRRDGQVRIRLDPLPNVFLVLQQCRLLETTELRRKNIARQSIALHQLDDTARTDTEPFGNLPARATLLDRLDDLAAKIIRIGTRQA